MVEIAEIVDKKNLEAWLKSQPNEVSLTIAHRAAMRALPLFWNWTLFSNDAAKRSIGALPILWANLSSGVVAHCPSAFVQVEIESNCSAAADDVTRVATRAYAGFDTLTLASHYSAKLASAVSDETFGLNVSQQIGTMNAAEYFAKSAAKAVAYTVDKKQSNAGNSNARVWSSTRSDCTLHVAGANLGRVPLWSNRGNPNLELWMDTKKKLPKDITKWQFWIKWYEAELAGEPLSCAMLAEIAKIKQQEWQRGPLHVNGLIAEIEEEFEGTSEASDGPKTANPLPPRAILMSMTADGMATHISGAIERYLSDTGKNELPDEFKTLEALPAVFNAISAAVISGGADKSKALESNIADLNAKIEQLEEGIYNIETLVRKSEVEFDMSIALEQNFVIKSIRMPRDVTDKREFAHEAYLYEATGKALYLKTANACKVGKKIISWL